MNETVEQASPKSSRVALIASSAICVLVLVAVVYGAMRGRGDEVADTDPFSSTNGTTPNRSRFTDPTGCGSVDPEKPPRLELSVPPKGVDFGRIKQGVRLEKEIVFKNVGEGTLCVLDVNTGCGCLKARLQSPQRKRYEPGESGSITITLDSSDREGKITKRVRVITNELDTPTHEFETKADISLAVVVAPPRVSFGRVPRNTPTKAVVSIRSPLDDTDWKVTGVVGMRRTRAGKRLEYTFDVKPVPNANQNLLQLTIHHPGLTDIGPFRDPLILQTTHPERPEIALQSFIEITPRISARPPRVALGFVSSGSRRPPMRVRLVPGGPDVRFEITGVEVEPKPGREVGPGGPGFAAAFGMEDDGTGWVDVQYDGKSRKPGLVEAVVVVATTDPEMPEVRVPVSATIRKARK